MLNSSSTASINGLNASLLSLNHNDNDKSVNSMLNSSTLTITAGNVNGKFNNTNLINTSQLGNLSIYVPQIKSKNSGEYLGVLEWKIEDETKIINKLIDGLFFLINKIILR